jgi:hypothetical protein
VLDRLFYPYTTPSLVLQASPNLVEYGNVSQAVVLDWSILSGINNVAASNIYRPLQSPVSLSTPVAFATAIGTLGSNNLVPNTLTIFTFSVNDSITDTIATASVDWSLSRYWGTLSTGNLLLTVTSSTFNYSDISTLNFELDSSYIQSREIMTNNDYVVFVWPNSSINLQSFPPKSFINGLANNDWTKTRDNIIFTNQWGYTASYDVWKFNNIQGNFTSSYVITN